MQSNYNQRYRYKGNSKRNNVYRNFRRKKNFGRRNFSRNGQFRRSDNYISRANRNFRPKNFFIPKRGYNNLPPPSYNVRKKTKILGGIKKDRIAYYEYKEPIDSLLPQASDFNEIRKYFIDKLKAKEDIRVGTNNLMYVSDSLPIEFQSNDSVIPNSYEILATFYLDQLLISPIYRKSFCCYYKEIWAEIGVFELKEEMTSKVLNAIEKNEELDISSVVDAKTQKDRADAIIKYILAVQIPDDKLKELSDFLLIKNSVDTKDTIYDTEITNLTRNDLIVPTYFKTSSNYWRTRIGSLSNYDPREVKLSVGEIFKNKLILDVNSISKNQNYSIQPNDLHLFIISVLKITNISDPIALITQQYKGQPIYMLVF